MYGLFTSTVHPWKITMVCRPYSSMVHPHTVHPSGRTTPSTCHKLSWSVVQIRLWGGRSMTKIRPLVHLKIIVLVQRSNLFMRWTVWAQISVHCRHGRMDSPQTAVFVRGGLIYTRIKIIWSHKSTLYGPCSVPSKSSGRNRRDADNSDVQILKITTTHTMKPRYRKSSSFEIHLISSVLLLILLIH